MIRFAVEKITPERKLKISFLAMNISDPQKKHAEVKTGDIITFGRYSVDDWDYSPIE